MTIGAGLRFYKRNEKGEIIKKFIPRNVVDVVNDEIIFEEFPPRYFKTEDGEIFNVRASEDDFVGEDIPVEESGDWHAKIWS